MVVIKEQGTWIPQYTSEPPPPILQVINIQCYWILKYPAPHGGLSMLQRYFEIDHLSFGGRKGIYPPFPLWFPSPLLLSPLSFFSLLPLYSSDYPCPVEVARGDVLVSNTFLFIIMIMMHPFQVWPDNRRAP